MNLATASTVSRKTAEFLDQVAKEVEAEGREKDSNPEACIHALRHGSQSQFRQVTFKLLPSTARAAT